MWPWVWTIIKEVAIGAIISTVLGGSGNHSGGSHYGGGSYSAETEEHIEKEAEQYANKFVYVNEPVNVEELKGVYTGLNGNVFSTMYIDTVSDKNGELLFRCRIISPDLTTNQAVGKIFEDERDTYHITYLKLNLNGEMEGKVCKVQSIETKKVHIIIGATNNNGNEIGFMSK